MKVLKNAIFGILLPLSLMPQQPGSTSVESLQTADKSPVWEVEVEVVSVPSGAAVYINDEEMGHTPVTFTHKSGRHRINIELENYEEIDEIIVLKPPEARKSYTLTDTRANLSIITFNKSRVYINGERIFCFCDVKLIPGEYKVKVEMDGAPALERSFSLASKEQKKLILYPDVPTGAVQADISPADASVMLWEDDCEKYTAAGSKIFSNIPEGRYNLKVSKKGFKSKTVQLDVKAGEVVRTAIKISKGAEVGGDYILVKGGSYNMGGGGVRFDEQPARKVSLSDYFIGKYEVTQAEWNLLMGKTPCEFKGDSLPVESVSWFEAVKFCNKMSIAEGFEPSYIIKGDSVSWVRSANGYRLPTEAEWEFAARCGRGGRCYNYCGGDSLDQVAEYEGNNNISPKPVGSRRPNGLGMHDMSGNVSEWCWDWYYPYPDGPEKDPAGPNHGHLRTNRGGSWFSKEEKCRVVFRNLYNPAEAYSFVGFRLARNAK
jgi:formylglycine-generating enzyme